MKRLCKYNNKEYLCIGSELIDNKKVIILDEYKSKYLFDENKTLPLWSFRYEFIKYYNTFMKENKLKQIKNKSLTCKICNKLFDRDKINIFKEFIWSSLLLHYMEYHNYRPPHAFIYFILQNLKDGKKYVKINQNNLQFFDALLVHGGYHRKFKEKHSDYMRNAEYLGYLNFICNGKCKLKNIEMLFEEYAPTDKDSTIFFPTANPEIFYRTYFFHTHPYGYNRVYGKIVYEFPSNTDIDTFIYVSSRYDKKLCGSLVVASEGIYDIQKINNTGIDDSDLLTYEKAENILRRYINYAYDKYKDHILYREKDEMPYFDYDFFMSVISQDTESLEKINSEFNKFNIIIKYYPRQKDSRGEWVYGSIYLGFYDN